MSLFGQSQPQNRPLFGSLSTNTNNVQSGGLFGNQQNQQNQQSGGLFENQQNQQPQNGLFGGQQNTTPQQQQGSGLFGQSSQPAGGSSLFGQQQQQQQQQQAQQQPTSLFGQQASNTSTFGNPQQQLQQNNRSLWEPGSTLAPRQKTIPEQMQTLLEKWSPQSQTCLFQHYFYNEVRSGTAAFYAAPSGEDETKWEEALSKKPDEDAIPVLCKGFAMLGSRLKTQVQGVSALQSRLHEINYSLTAMLEAHDMEISVKANDARRRHVALSQRCLRLAAKIQILRNRGYALDGPEEGLRKKMIDLERATFDARLKGRQEEIWARMVELRHRTRYLQEETARAGAASADKEGDALDPEALKQTKKILSHYDAQIARLSGELDTVRKDFEEVEKGGESEQTIGRR